MPFGNVFYEGVRGMNMPAAKERDSSETRGDRRALKKKMQTGSSEKTGY